MSRLMLLLKWLRLVDVHDGVVSLTSLAVWIVLVKLALVRSATVPDLAALLGSLGLYHAKRLASAATVARAAVVMPPGQIAQALAEVKQVRDELRTQEGKFRLMLDTVAMGRR